MANLLGQVTNLFKPCCLCLALSVVMALDSSGQEVTASITGRITDSSSAVVPGAKVTATNTAQGAVWTTESNNDGAYGFPRLPVGTYNIKVEKGGFQITQQSNILLVLNQTARMDFSLQVGNVAQSVEVPSAPPLLKTDSTQIDTTLDARTNEALPLATRNFVQLTLLSAGSVTTNPSEYRPGAVVLQRKTVRQWEP